MNLQAIVASLRADVDVILDVRVPEPEATLADPTEDTVLAALFWTTLRQCLCQMSMPRGIKPKRVTRLLLGRESVMILRLKGEPCDA